MSKVFNKIEDFFKSYKKNIFSTVAVVAIGFSVIFYSTVYLTSYGGVNGFHHKVGITFDLDSGEANGTYRLDVENPCVNTRFTTGRIQASRNHIVNFRYSITPKEHYHEYNGTIFIDVKVNDEVHHEIIDLLGDGRVDGYFEYDLGDKTYADINYEITGITGTTVYHHDTKVKKATKKNIYHIKSNGLWFRTIYDANNESSNIDYAMSNFEVDNYGLKNRTRKTLYLPDYIHTKSGVSIKYNGYGLCSDAPRDYNVKVSKYYDYYNSSNRWKNVETLILDGSFSWKQFEHIKVQFPKLRTLYIENMNFTGYTYNGGSVDLLIPYGVTVYLGDELYDKHGEMFNNDSNLRAVKHTSEFTITEKMKNNR